MNTLSLAKAGWASTWTMAWISETPVSITGFGSIVTWISGMGGGGPPVLPPPPLEVAQPALAATLPEWCAHHAFVPLAAAEATPDMPRSGMLTTTAMETSRTKLRDTFTVSLLVVELLWCHLGCHKAWPQS